LELCYTFALSPEEKDNISRALQSLRELPLAADATSGILYRQMLGPTPSVAVTSSFYRLQDANRFALDVEKFGCGFQVILEWDGAAFRAVQILRYRVGTCEAEAWAARKRQARERRLSPTAERGSPLLHKNSKNDDIALPGPADNV
jgi:hypothetical protein